jgi:hypothetical protein
MPPQVQESERGRTLPDRRSGIRIAHQESRRGARTQRARHLSCNSARKDRLHVPTNSRQVQHWTENLPARLALHTEGRGARLVEVVIGQGIGFVLARTWQGDRFLERALKRRRMAPRYCPICREATRRRR